MASEKKVVEAEYTEVVEELTPEDARYVMTEFTVGIDDQGSAYYRIGGKDQSLIVLEGLLKYAHVQMERLWARSLEMSSQKEEEGA